MIWRWTKIKSIRKSTCDVFFVFSLYGCKSYLFISVRIFQSSKIQIIVNFEIVFRIVKKVLILTKI